MGKTKEEKEREKAEKKEKKERKKELKKLSKQERSVLEMIDKLGDPATPASSVIEILKTHNSQLGGEAGVRGVVAAMRNYAQSADVQYMGCNVLAILMGAEEGDAGVRSVISLGGDAAALRAFKTHKRERNVVRWAAVVLERATAAGPEVPGRILAGGLTDGFGQSLVSALRLYASDDEVLRNCMRIMLHISKVNPPATAKLLADAGGLDVLIAALAAHPGVPDVALPACKLLADLTHTRTNVYGRRFCELGGVDAVTKAMAAAAVPEEEEEDEAAAGCRRDIQFVAIKVFSNVTNNNPWAQALMAGESGGFALVVEAMRAYPADADVQVWGASVFAHIDSAAAPAAAQSLYEAGGAEVLVAALGAHRGAKLVQETGCKALGNLALNDEGRAHGISACGGMEAALASITGHKRVPSVVQAGCYALTSIAYACQAEECLEKVTPHVEMFVNMLKYYKDEQYIQEYGWNLLATLALNDPVAVQADTAVIATTIGRAGGIEAVLSQIGAHGEDACIVENGIQLLATILVTDENKARAVACDGIRAIVLSMNRYPASQMVHFWGCIALGNIVACSAPAVQNAVSRNSALALAVLRSLRENRADVDIQTNACIALANAANTSATARAIIGRNFGVETIIALMRRHAGDDSAALLVNCCAALAALARGSAENQTRISACGGIGDIAATLRAFRADDYVACACIDALAAFTLDLYKLVECGGLDTVLRAMFAHSTPEPDTLSAQIYAAGAQIFARLSYSSTATSNTVAIVRPPVPREGLQKSVLCQRIAAAVARMDECKLDPAAQAAGCDALMKCCPIPLGEQETAVACGCVEAPIFAALIHIDDPAVQERAWQALTALTAAAQVCAYAGQLLAVELATCVLRRYSGRGLERVAGAVCRALGALLTRCGANSGHAGTDLVGLVLGAMAEHMACRAVHEGGCQALAGALIGPCGFHAANDTVANGGIGVLLSSIAGAAGIGAPGAARWGCIAIATIASSSEENREYLAFSNGADAVASGAITAFPNYQEVQEAGCEALCRILTARDGAAPALDERYCTPEIAAAVTAAAQRYPNSPSVQRACALINEAGPPLPPRGQPGQEGAKRHAKQARRRAAAASTIIPANVAAAAISAPAAIAASAGSPEQGIATLGDLAKMDIDEVTMWFISLGVATMKASGLARKFGITGAKLARVAKKENLLQVGFDDKEASAIFARLADLTRRSQQEELEQAVPEAPAVVPGGSVALVAAALGELAADFYETLGEALAAAGAKGTTAIAKRVKETAVRVEKQGVLAPLGMSLENAMAISALADGSDEGPEQEGSPYRAANKALAAGSGAARGLVLQALAALRKLPAYTEGAALYFAARDAQAGERYRAGQSTLTWPGFVFATTDVRAAQDILGGISGKGSGPCVFEVRGRFRGYDVREFVRTPRPAQDVLLEPGTTFRVLQVRPDPDVAVATRITVEVVDAPLAAAEAVQRFSATADMINNIRPSTAAAPAQEGAGTAAAAGEGLEERLSKGLGQGFYQPLKVALIGAVGCDAAREVLRAYKAAVADAPGSEAADVMSERQLSREDGAALYALGNSERCRAAVAEALAGAGRCGTAQAALTLHVLEAARKLEAFEDLPSLYVVAARDSVLGRATAAAAEGSEMTVNTLELAYMDEDAANEKAAASEGAVVVEVQGRFAGYDVTPFLGDGREMVLLELGQTFKVVEADDKRPVVTVEKRRALAAQGLVEKFANSSPLPPNWAEKKDPATGVTNYFNKVTKQTQHMRPKVHDPNFFN